jgi:hypothetical protein
MSSHPVVQLTVEKINILKKEIFYSLNLLNINFAYTTNVAPIILGEIKTDLAWCRIAKEIEKKGRKMGGSNAFSFDYSSSSFQPTTR